MITDHIRNRDKYYFLGEDYKLALDYFAALTGEPFEDEDIPIGNGNSSIKARNLMTKTVEDSSFEAHRVFADIHFVVDGKEKIGYTDLKKLEPKTYDKEQDLAFLDGTGDFITLLPGYFLIAFPEDGHMPCVCVDEPEPIAKMIAKIEVKQNLLRVGNIALNHILSLKEVKGDFKNDTKGKN